MSEYWPVQARRELWGALNKWKEGWAAFGHGRRDAHYKLAVAPDGHVEWRLSRRALALLEEALVKSGFDAATARAVGNDMRETETRAWVRGDFWPRVAALTVKHAMINAPADLGHNTGTLSSVHFSANKQRYPIHQG